MTITPMMQYIQDRILEAVHGCSLEEARKKDLKFGCLVMFVRDGTSTSEDGITTQYLKYQDNNKENIDHFLEDPVSNLLEKKIIGLPPTLSRVLTALGGNSAYQTDLGKIRFFEAQGKYFDIERKLIKDSGEDATLFDQSQETITAIALLLGRKDKCNELNDMKNGRIA